MLRLGVLLFPILVSLLSCAGCVWLGPGIPVRVPTQTKDILGTRREIDLTFLRVGFTTRDEVKEKLQGIDTKIDDRSLFWGRWETSDWVWAPMLAPYLGGRDWAPQNVLITYDQAGRVKEWKIVKDKQLLKELDLLLGDVPLDPSRPVHLYMKVQSTSPDVEEMILSPDHLDYRGSRSLTIARRNLTGLSVRPEVLPEADPTNRPQPQPDPSHIWIRIHFSKRTIRGKSLTAGVDPAGFLLLRSYVKARPPAQKHFGKLTAISTETGS